VKAQWWTAWVLAGIGIFSLRPQMAVAQQDDGPILRPRVNPKPVQPLAATLLVICDLDCTWKLDGVAMGPIAAGSSAKAKIELGEHLVVAFSRDGLDTAEVDRTVKETGQSIVQIKLRPVREARLKAEELRQSADREKAERAANERAEREREASLAAEKAKQRPVANPDVWIDPSTSLEWTKKNNGRFTDLGQAQKYCQTMQLAGRSDWRLPTKSELQGIFDPAVQGNVRINGNLQLSLPVVWATINDPAASTTGPYFEFFLGGDGSEILYATPGFSAICVRRSGQ